jgi:hypothetical protein
MLPQYFLILLIPLTIARVYSYTVDIISKEIKPNLSSWIIWVMANAISFVGSLLKGIPVLEVSNTILTTISLICIVGISLYCKQYYVDPTNTDKICFSLGMVGLLLLIFVQEKNLAIGLSIIIDSIACFPTLYKIWTNKNESDNAMNFVYSFGMAFLNLSTLTQFNFANSAFSFYKLVSTSSLFGSVFIKNNKLHNNLEIQS